MTSHDAWLMRLRSSVLTVGSGGEVPPGNVWHHDAAYVLARRLGATNSGADALGILILVAVGAPLELIGIELRRLKLWDGKQSRIKGMLGAAWTTALSEVPSALKRDHTSSRFGAAYNGPRWWESR